MTDSLATDEAFLNEMATLMATDTLELLSGNFASGLNEEQDCLSALDLLLPNDTNADSSNTSEENADKRALAREKETKRRRIYRQKLKDERAELQNQVDELTLTLESLRQSVLHRTTANALALQDDSSGDSSSNELWKAVATWELDSLRRSLGEQKRLQNAVATKAKLIKDLRTVISKRVARSASSRVLSQTRCLRPPDTALIDALLHQVEVNYTQVDEVLCASVLNSMKEGVVNSMVKNPSDGSLKELLHVNKRLLPFPFQPTCRVFWSLAKLEHRQHDRAEYENIEAPENTIMMTFRVMKVLKTGKTMSMRQRVVSRRYVQGDSVVLVWKIFFGGEGILKGMHSDESGWCRFRPSTSQGGTWMEMHVRRTPLHYRNAVRRGSVVGQFQDVLTNCNNEDQEKVMRGLESLMLDDTLTGTITSTEL